MLQQLLKRSSSSARPRASKGGFVGISSPGLRHRLVVLDASSSPGALVIQRALERDMPGAIMGGAQVQEPTQLSDAWREWVVAEKLQRTRASIGIPALMTHTMLRRANVTRADHDALLRQVSGLQAMRNYLNNPELVHFNVAILDPDSSSDRATALVVASKKDLIRPRQDAAIESGLLVERCEFEPVALWNLLTLISPERAVKGLGMLVVGEEHSAIVLCDDHGPVSVRSLGIGVETLIREIAASEGGITPDLIRRQVAGGEPLQDLYPSPFEGWAMRLVELVNTGMTGAGGRGATSLRLDDLLLMGEGALIGGLPDLLSRDVRSEQAMKVEVFNPFLERAVTLGNGIGLPEQDGPLWTVPLALAASLVEG